MPVVASCTPEWLSKPNPGHEIFVEQAVKAQDRSHGSGKRGSKPGPRKTIARRGTEVFTAVGREIRWADLVYLKEAWENEQLRKKATRQRKSIEPSQYDGDRAQGYRTLKVPVAEDIRQLIISPQANYLAILTTHTVHIGLLPDSSHLTSSDTSPMNLKAYTLGPTTHVTSQPAIVSALWHPLGVNGSCLVTVTEDAIVRVWELSPGDRWSFDKPTLAIDLKRLADGTSIDQDFSASISQNKGFTPDSVEMEVASACFASRGSGGWSPMILWIAMREGDVYALCPLLPNKWQPPPTLIPSLSVSIVSKIAELEDDPSMSGESKQLAQQQLAWMADLDSQDPVAVESPSGELAAIYTRPAKPGRIPKLQGPFDFDAAPEESEDSLDDLLSDIFVIGAKLDPEELMFGEEDELEDDIDQEGLSLGVVCLLASSGRLSICLDIVGVEAQWLPKTQSKVVRPINDNDTPSLLTFQVIDTLRNDEMSEQSWPMFSQDVNSRYSFYVTNMSSVTFISLSPWVFRLENELTEGAAGTDFRLDLLVNGENSIRERHYNRMLNSNTNPLAATILIRDPDLGYVLLTADRNGPHAISFESPETDDYDLEEGPRSPTFEEDATKPVNLFAPRETYQPSTTMNANSDLPRLLRDLKHGKYKHTLNAPVRLSPVTLITLAEAHKVLGNETNALGEEAARLFRNCERLQIELQGQIAKALGASQRIDAITVGNSNDGPVVSMPQKVDDRIQAAHVRQKELEKRFDRVKKNLSRGAADRELTAAELAWNEEIDILRVKVLGEGKHDELFGDREKEPWARYKQVEEVKDELLEQVQDAVENEERVIRPKSVKVPSEVRRVKVAQIETLLARETALVEAARSRLSLSLERLSLA
ncbi:hypothetical protein BJ875DRAFT_419034 [Amylocarpus encephaloides]|uniref:Nuclear pore complex protein An-Nup82 n=1 Tax=Amylocarpus encephaloides TaxID=45428 RepID=A0A9P7YPW8_9HELO|nr:hypothetical protein BJ875DRAFT_419034 [Amylocarpus encephaloides]